MSDDNDAVEIEPEQMAGWMFNDLDEIGREEEEPEVVGELKWRILEIVRNLP